jgi:hypothetical protein
MVPEWMRSRQERISEKHHWCQAHHESRSVTNSFQPPLLSDENRRQIRSYTILATSTYLIALGITTVVIVCTLLGILDTGRLVMAFAMLPVIARYGVVYPVLRRIAKLTGEEVATPSLPGLMIPWILLGLLVFLACR